MKIVISGSLGNIGKPLTKTLVQAGHEVTVITSQPQRKSDIETLGAKPAVGSVQDSSFLATTIKGADALFAMTPPNLGGSDVISNTTRAGQAFADAIKTTGIKRVVMLSSIGGDLPTGNGPIAGIHNIEQIYSSLKGVSFTFLRAGYFYFNFFNDVPLIQHMGIIGSNYPASVRLPLVHPKDIAAAAAEELLTTHPENTVRYIVSDHRTAAEVAKTLGTAVGKPELPWVEFTDEQALQGMQQAGIPDEIAALYAEMGAGLRSGIIQKGFEQAGAPITGKTKLEEFAKEFKL